MKILIVDDDLVDRQIVKRALQLSSTRYDVVEAETVDQGFVYYNEQQFDLVLLDYRMPGKDGMEMLMNMHNANIESKAAVVVMSNSEDEQIALDALQMGAQDFILKSEINGPRLRRSILHAKTRFELEKQLHESYKKVKHLAERDTLTGLPNRHLFDETLKFTVANNRRHDHKVALLLIDLDNFKYVNDSFGHDVGDILLKRVVQRIYSCLRGAELFARLGGDEFGIVLSSLDGGREASFVAQRILRVLEKPFEIKARSFSSGASIGIALHPENGDTPEGLLKYADIAMYRAKKLGKNQVCFFAEEMQEEFVSRHEIEQKLRQAIDKEEISLNFQPMYYATDHRLGGFEVLLNWVNDEGRQSSRQYLPVAEESKLIIPIGQMAIEKAVEQQVQWSEKLNSAQHMSINLSPAQLSDRGLIPFLKELFETYHTSPSHYIFEIAEVALQAFPEMTAKSIKTLQALGCRVALDDFGVGASSIDNLRKYPFDLVKLDPRFLPGMVATDKDIALFESVVKMIRALEFEMVVVGVETIEQVELCCALGVEQMQGHFFAKPEPADFIEEHYLLRTIGNE